MGNGCAFMFNDPDSLAESGQKVSKGFPCVIIKM